MTDSQMHITKIHWITLQTKCTTPNPMEIQTLILPAKADFCFAIVNKLKRNDFNGFGM